MKAGVISATLLIIAVGAMGCGAVPEPPLACTDEEFTVGDHGDFSFAYCEALGMVCNEAVTAADKCPGFVVELEAYIREVLLPMISDELSFLPSFFDVEELVAMVFDHYFDQYAGVCGEIESLDEIGTCQCLGNLEDPCAEDADCLGDLVCLEETCTVPPEEPECVIDGGDCDPGLVCEEGVCVEPQSDACVEDANCPGDLVCMEETCIDPPPAH